MRLHGFGIHARLATALVALAVGCLDAPTAPMRAPVRAADAHSERGGSAPAHIEFAALAPGDEVSVHFESDGCFHHVAAEVVLTREANGLAIALNHADANLIPSTHFAAAPALDAEEMLRLDRVLGFYRSNRSEGCTTVDHVTLRVLSGAWKGIEESYTDASCGTMEASTYYPFGALVRVVRDSRAKGAV
jgi:hypothetical protein